MTKGRGIILEVHDEYSVFLTSDGGFIKGVPSMDDPIVGVECSFTEFIPVTSMLNRTVKWKMVYPVLAAAATLLLVFGMLFGNESTASAYIQVDADSSFEIGVNDQGEVVHFSALDDNGEAFIRQLKSWKGEQLSSVLSDIMKNYSKETQTNPITVTTIFHNEADSLRATIDEAIEETKTELPSIAKQVEKEEASFKEYEAAKERGVSVQSYISEDQSRDDQKAKENRNDVKQKPVNGTKENKGSEKAKDPKKGPNDNSSKSNGKSDKPSTSKKDQTTEKELNGKNNENHGKKHNNGSQVKKEASKKQSPSNNPSSNRNNNTFDHHKENGGEKNRNRENHKQNRWNENKDNGKQDKGKGHNH
ncbi:anti-sigma factor domain-containing protein [Paenisporosarcina cavernae]|uniref:RsgI N-terminal anti-sigma domain-containing protein n=1 Tax=Paenisporosarcina cavernae TaxID=2320858 RepID=A0A385YR50_9BACL|nr:hypothetical protein [Paenisporosarcina cavernae]AYC29056.1 hypothetical protein D3873_03885 [Paenisporosarcina cavernae]